jgi:hypothetical protein
MFGYYSLAIVASSLLILVVPLFAALSKLHRPGLGDGRLETAVSSWLPTNVDTIRRRISGVSPELLAGQNQLQYLPIGPLRSSALPEWICDSPACSIGAAGPIVSRTSGYRLLVLRLCFARHMVRWSGGGMAYSEH